MDGFGTIVVILLILECVEEEIKLVCSIIDKLLCVDIGFFACAFQDLSKLKIDKLFFLIV